MAASNSHCGRRAVAAALGLALGAACSGAGGTHEIEEVREVHRSFPMEGLTTSERFGLAEVPGAAPHGGGGPTALQAGGGRGFRFDLPPGWREVPGSAMRQLDFRMAAHPDAECYLTVLPGLAGGAVANVNRWRGQMGLDAQPAAEVRDLPRSELLGAEALFVELEGTFSGMGGEERADYALLGLLAEQGSSTVFLKMVGPARVVAEERAAFERLAASLAPADAPATRTAGGAQGLVWSAPDGWTRQPERSMRVVTFVPEEAPDVECYVTLLTGDAGGVFANVNRWAGQMGAPPFDVEQLEELERLDVLGVEATLVEVAGHYTGMSGEEVPDATLVGLVCPLGAHTVFVKMTGPRAAVEGQRGPFLAFCRSLDYGG